MQQDSLPSPDVMTSTGAVNALASLAALSATSRALLVCHIVRTLGDLEEQRKAEQTALLRSMQPHLLRPILATMQAAANLRSPELLATVADLQRLRGETFQEPLSQLTIKQPRTDGPTLMTALLRVLEDAASAHSPVEMTQLSRQQHSIASQVWEVASVIKRLPDLSRSPAEDFAMLVSGIKSGQSHRVAVLSCLENSPDDLLSLMDPVSRMTPLHVLAEAAVATTAWPVSLDWKKGGDQLADIKALTTSNDRHNVDLMHPFGTSGYAACMLDALSFRNGPEMIGGQMEGSLERFIRIGRFALARDSRGHTPLDILVAAHHKDARDRQKISEAMLAEIMKRADTLEKSMRVFDTEHKKIMPSGWNGRLNIRQTPSLLSEAEKARVTAIDPAAEEEGGANKTMFGALSSALGFGQAKKIGSGVNQCFEVAATILTGNKDSSHLRLVLDLLRTHYCASVEDLSRFEKEILPAAQERYEEMRRNSFGARDDKPYEQHEMDIEIIRLWKKMRQKANVDLRRFHSLVTKMLRYKRYFDYPALYPLIDQMDSNRPEADIRKTLTDMLYNDTDTSEWGDVVKLFEYEKQTLAMCDAAMREVDTSVLAPKHKQTQYGNFDEVLLEMISRRDAIGYSLDSSHQSLQGVLKQYEKEVSDIVLKSHRMAAERLEKENAIRIHQNEIWRLRETTSNKKDIADNEIDVKTDELRSMRKLRRRAQRIADEKTDQKTDQKCWSPEEFTEHDKKMEKIEEELQLLYQQKKRRQGGKKDIADDEINIKTEEVKTLTSDLKEANKIAKKTRNRSGHQKRSMSTKRKLRIFRRSCSCCIRIRVSEMVARISKIKVGSSTYQTRSKKL